jgi:hypothetical protein
LRGESALTFAGQLLGVRQKMPLKQRKEGEKRATSGAFFRFEFLSATSLFAVKL